MERKPQLISVFVFAYADNRSAHLAAHCTCHIPYSYKYFVQIGMSKQENQIRQILEKLEEQSDAGLQCLPSPLHLCIECFKFEFNDDFNISHCPKF